jgi:hypothetical protein
MEDSDASDYSAPATSFLATSEARRRLSQLAAKRDASKKKAQSISPDGPSAPLEAPIRAVNGPLLGAPVPVIAPQTPTTTRRNMIMNEMSESLRMSEFQDRSPTDTQTSSGSDELRKRHSTHLSGRNHLQPPPGRSSVKFPAIKLRLLELLPMQHCRRPRVRKTCSKSVLHPIQSHPLLS